MADIEFRQVASGRFELCHEHGKIFVTPCVACAVERFKLEKTRKEESKGESDAQDRS